MNINYGVLVGRFQVHRLHSGHIHLMHEVQKRHQRVIIFLGQPRTVPTKRNPLDFETRKKMIQAEFPDFIVLPLRDEKHDSYWSARLDLEIEACTNFTQDITLYGSRDSFVPHYFGKHKVVELEIPSPISGTEIRDQLSNEVLSSADFRAGIIYAFANQFPRVLPTADMAVLYNDGQGNIKMLLGKKPGEDDWRFPGGFANKGESFETSARREAYEETGLDVSSVEYIGSFPINDWRYAKDNDASITTSFYLGWSTTLKGKAGDDLATTKWFDFSDLPPVIVENHMVLFEAVKKFIGKRYPKYATQSSSSN